MVRARFLGGPVLPVGCVFCDANLARTSLPPFPVDPDQNKPRAHQHTHRRLGDRGRHERRGIGVRNRAARSNRSQQLLVGLVGELGREDSIERRQLTG